MRILFEPTLGLGNVIETIPAYLQLVKKFGKENVDVMYFKRYPTDSVLNTDIFPYDKEIKELQPGENLKVEKEYDYYFRSPELFTKGDFVKESIDSFREHDSEVMRSLRALEYLGCETEILKDFREERPKDFIDEPYITVHNGALNVPAWANKKYPMFPRLVQLLKKYTSRKIICLGKKHEYIQGAIDKTECSVRETAYWINHAEHHICTDTSTMHIAALVDTKCIAIFTCTDWIYKNIDKNFHELVKFVTSGVSCSPCQKSYHWHPNRVDCLGFRLLFPCQNINPEKILKNI